jgi:hypothetical protein
MKSKLLLIGFLLFFSLAGDGPPVDPLTQDEMKNAIQIADPNVRSTLVGPGKSVIYRVQGTDIYLEVYNESRSLKPLSMNFDKFHASRYLGKSSLASFASFRPLFTWTATQTCGVNVYLIGLPVAQLRNRANVTYFQATAAKAPAKFNWYDMSGTKTLAIGFSWTNLSQSSSPSVGVQFNTSGWVKAEGNLNGCLAGICLPQNYYVSRMDVNTSGTFCR